ncbi:hypothetical protein L249_0002 [Ophiocordyceps polyrhachis-furcata BCC 54312]|uniref:Uncharacterized protein n=1 Tax=Ophiocordyceps polyrhachis-furcata BCC 54312 TaxID=1330021 RepID=A0A367LCY4_9HYPO|nr:hypothetical protein L249_0002 [Ophiocordyceps polyrhachis-furcata BCC 54312]
MVSTRRSARLDTWSAQRRNSGRTSRRRRSSTLSCPSLTESDDGSDTQTTDDATYIAHSEPLGNFTSRKRRRAPQRGGKPKTTESPQEGRNPNEPPAKSRRLVEQQHGHGLKSLIPDWKDPRIPFDCWISIFLYAAHSDTADDLASHWLVQAATTCRTLAEPALTALYMCPPLKGQPARVKRLAALLDRSPLETLLNYRMKVKYLHLDVQLISQAALYRLIHPLSGLKELLLYTRMDQPPYRSLDTTIRWWYTEGLFTALAPAEGDPSDADAKPFPTMLKSWEWSGRFFGGSSSSFPTIHSVASIHDTPSFSNLTKLSFTNLQLPSLTLMPESEEEKLDAFNKDGQMVEAVANAISRLKYLNHLVVESSTVMNDRLLPLLPEHLAHLELINCWEVRSEELACFLNTHGSNLRTLSLLHNQSLHLGFLTTLSENCPCLRELHINLSYYRHHECVNDADPMFDQALVPTEIPTWPSSLRVISIEHLRDCSVEAAEAFFQSLIDSARKLPNLRHLAIKTRLDIPWQARAMMRHKWRASMEKVFLRPVRSPRPHVSLRAPINDDNNVPEPKRRGATTAAVRPSLRRRSRRIAAHVGGRTSAANKRLRRRQGKPFYRDPDTDEDEAELTEEEEEEEGEEGEGDDAVADDGKGELPIQGLCDTVNIQLDNQKVRELQYGMEDFRDEDEAESEDEWQGDEDEDESPVIIFR